MCSSAASVHRSSFQGIVDPFSFSTFHLLKTCNRILLPSDLRNYYHQISKDDNNNCSNKTLVCDQDDNLLKQSSRNSEIHSPAIDLMFPNNNKNLPINLPTLPPITNILPTAAPPIDYQITDFPLAHRIGSNDFGAYNTSILNKRQRGEKRPIPAEQKDEKYFERRKRNNEAAKKSRDARKMREDRIAFRAAILEQENAILRAQLISIREENAVLRSQK